MAVSKIRVNTGSLDHTREEVQAKLNGIRKNADQISGDMDRLKSMWSGEAHQAFVEQVAADMEALRAACDSIQKIIQYENTAVTEYNKCEQQVADLIAQIKI